MILLPLQSGSCPLYYLKPPQSTLLLENVWSFFTCLKNCVCGEAQLYPFNLVLYLNSLTFDDIHHFYYLLGTNEEHVEHEFIR